MKTRYIYLALAGMVAVGTTSCTDNLDIDQHGVLNYETYYQTEAEIESAITAAYVQQKSLVMTVHLSKECLSGDFWSAGGTRGDNASYEELNEFRFTSEQSGIQSWFSSYYSLINYANIVIDNVAKAEEKGTALANSDVAKRAAAEARVFRAWSYFELTTMWGNPPIVLHELVSESEYAVPNGTAEELWALMEKDLTDAIASGKLSEKSSVNDVQWRITKQYAQAILGKVYLWQKKNKPAADILDEVINSGKYALYGENNKNEKFEDVIQMTAKNNCESMFESQSVVDENNWEFNLYGAMLRWRFEKFDMTAEFQSTYYTGQDYGFMNPTKELYDAFASEETPGKYGSRFLQTMKTVPEMADMGGKLKNGKTVHGCEGYFFWKWRAGKNTDNPGGAMAGFSYCNNFRWMRFAEVLLLAAEAHIACNDAEGLALAASYINRIRKRAKVDEQKSSYTLEELKLEKRLELVGENVRYQDIQRWGDAPKLLKDFGSYCPVLYSNGNVEKKVFNNDPNSYGYKTGKHELLPIPFNEIRLNANIKQNPGWGGLN